MHRLALSVDRTGHTNPEALDFSVLSEAPEDIQQYKHCTFLIGTVFQLFSHDFSEGTVALLYACLVLSEWPALKP
jgi:hypothetical protein